MNRRGIYHTCHSHVSFLVMSLLKYFNKLPKDGDVYPKKVSSLTPKQLEIVNQKVQEVKRNENCGTYNKYLPEERARIGKYTAR